MTEEQLLLRLRNGDRQAFELIYREYAPRLRAYCLNITKSQEDTQDLVQEAFAVLWEKRDTVHTGVAAFLFATLKNQLISLFRRRLHEPQYPRRRADIRPPTLDSIRFIRMTASSSPRSL